MERIDICTILLNESDTERQTISYDPDTRMLYTDAPGYDGPVDEAKYDTIQEAEDACNAMWGWGGCTVWDLQWIERDE